LNKHIRSEIMEISEQLHIVHQTALAYWEADPEQASDNLQKIQVIKRTRGKIMGFFPAYKQHPAVFFKVYFSGAFPYEVDGLQAALALPQIDGIEVANVVKIMPEFQAILTAKRSWEDTTTPLKRFFVRSLKMDWDKIGQWLRMFHDSRIEQNKNNHFLRRKFEKAERLVSTLHGLFSADQVDKMQAVIERGRNAFETEAVDWVISHGDFGLDNIKRSKDTLEVIDFEDCRMAPRCFDLINMITRLEYTGYFPHRLKFYAHIADQLLNGYGGIPGSPEAVCNFFYLLIKLDVIESYRRRSSTSDDPLMNRLVYQTFLRRGTKTMIAWLNGDYSPPALSLNQP